MLVSLPPSAYIRERHKLTRSRFLCLDLQCVYAEVHACEWVDVELPLCKGGFVISQARKIQKK